MGATSEVPDRTAMIRHGGYPRDERPTGRLTRVAPDLRQLVIKYGQESDASTVSWVCKISLTQYLDRPDPGYAFRRVTPDDADLLCRWRYGPGYGLHDLSYADRATLLRPDLHNFSVVRDAVLVGFACFGVNAQVCGGPYDGDALDLGCALAPERCGGGEGLAFVTAVAAFASRTFAARRLRLSVPEHNRRAVTVYRRAGFATRRRFAGLAGGGTHLFLLMTRDGDVAAPSESIISGCGG